MSLRKRWSTLSPAAKSRIAANLARQTRRVPRYTARLMERRQAAFHAYVNPCGWPGEVAKMREFFGSPIDQASATRIWALAHQRRLVEALRLLPRPRLP